MSSSKETYLSLVADLQLFLMQEYPAKEWIPTALENFHYFKALAASTPKAQPAPLVQSPSAPPPPLYQRKPLPQKAPARAPIAPPETKVEQPLNTAFEKEPLNKAAAADLSEMRKLIAEKHPKWEMLEPPSPREKGAAVIVFASKGDALLLSIAQAIQNQLASVQILNLEELNEKETLSKILEKHSLRLLVIDEQALRAYPFLLAHYRPNLGVIGSAPVVVLTDVAQLAHDPQRKRAVWNNIKERLV